MLGTLFARFRSLPPFMISALIALATSAAGFGVLNVFWLLGDWDPSVRGLWSFRAATLGDGFLLPLLLASLVSIVLALQPTPNERRFAIIAFLVGAGLFSLVVLSWLLEPAPELNWTIPRPHHLNSAGIYHAIFGPTLSGLITSSFALAFRRTTLQRATSTEIAVVDYWLLAATVLLAFAGSAAVDAVQPNGYAFEPFLRPEFLCTAIFTLATLILVLNPKAAMRRWRLIILPFLAGPAIVLAFWHPADVFHVPTGVALPLIAMVIPIGFHFSANRTRHWLIELPSVLLLLIFVLGSALHSIRSDHTRGAMGLIVASLLLAGLLLRRIEDTHQDTHHLKENFPFIIAAGYVIYLLALASVFDRAQQASNAVLLTAVFLPITLARIPRAASSRYAALIEDELSLGDRFKLGPPRADRCKSLEESYWATWIAILGFAVALIAIFIHVLSERGILHTIQSELANTESLGLQQSSVVLFICGASSALVLFTVSRIVKARPFTATVSGPTITDIQVEVGWPVFAACTFACFLWGAAPWIATFATDAFEPASRGWLNGLYPVGAVFGLWLGLVAGESIQYDVANTEFAELSGIARGLPWAAGFAVASVIFWLFGIGIWHDVSMASMPLVGQHYLLVTLGCLAIGVTLALVLYCATPDVRDRPSHRPRHLSLHSPPTNVANDLILHGLLMLVLVASIYTGVIISELVPAYRAAVIPVAIASPLAVFVAIYTLFFGVTNNTASEHCQREHSRISWAIWHRCGEDYEMAERENGRRVKVIEDKFDRVFRYARGVSFVYVGLDKVSQLLNRLMPEKPEDYGLEFTVSYRPGVSSSPPSIFANCLVHRFRLTGFESTPLDGQLLLRPYPPGPTDQQVEITTFRRDRQSGILEIPLGRDVAPGHYELSVQLKDKEGVATSAAAVRFDHDKV